MKILNFVLGFIVLMMLFPSSSSAGFLENIKIKQAIKSYQKTLPSVSLGDDKQKVLSVLEPTQKYLSANSKRAPESFYDEKKRLIEIYFYRSSYQNDDLVTDDEFTPFLFVNGILQAIGWQALGGPKTTGQAVPRTNINVNVRNSKH